jgi:hypothetical protein
MQPKARRNRSFGTHMTRAPDDAMSPRYRKGNWLSIIRCRRPAKGRDVLFVNDRGDMVVGEVRAGPSTLGASASSMARLATSCAACPEHGGDPHGTSCR